jgi:hypothetical protein
MRTLRAILLAISALCVAGQARAAEATGYDILTLRLAMTATEVLQVLAGQGIAGPAVQLTPAGCATAQADLCAQTIHARTRDGDLLLQLVRAPSGPERQIVYRIAYTITGRGPADADTLRADAIDRYGTPSSLSTTTWCPRLDIATGTCPGGQPRLHIEPTPKAAALITLMDDSMLTRNHTGDR